MDEACGLGGDVVRQENEKSEVGKELSAEFG